MPKIVILDGGTVYSDNISWHNLEKLGDVAYYESTPSDLVISRIGNAEIILTNKCVIDKNIIDSCRNLKYITVLATGYNVVDVRYANLKNIQVSNVPDYCTNSVIQHTFALLFELCSHVGSYNKSVHDMDWCHKSMFYYLLSPITELYGKTFGIIGYGNIGKRIANIVSEMGMNLLICSRTPSKNSVPLEYLLKNSDIVSLHCSLNENNKHLINENTLKLMKPTSYLINTARGGLIDEKALRYALDNNLIAGAALDVLSNEPPLMNNPLLGCKNCIITPHIAWATNESMMRLAMETEKNISYYLRGVHRNPVFAK